MSVITRLKKRQDFIRISRFGFRKVVSGMILLVAKNPILNTEEVRVGFTASRKLGNAVIRNRAKRRLRSLIQELLPESAHLGYDYVLIARHKTLTSSFDTLKQDLKAALKSITEQIDCKINEKH